MKPTPYQKYDKQAQKIITSHKTEIIKNPKAFKENYGQDAYSRYRETVDADNSLSHAEKAQLCETLATGLSNIEPNW